MTLLPLPKNGRILGLGEIYGLNPTRMDEKQKRTRSQVGGGSSLALPQRLFLLLHPPLVLPAGPILWVLSLFCSKR